jgi:hypothetical protein
LPCGWNETNPAVAFLWQVWQVFRRLSGCIRDCGSASRLIVWLPWQS